MALQNIYDNDGQKISNLLYDNKDDNYRVVKYRDRNCILNIFDGGKCELVHYTQGFKIPEFIVTDKDMISDSETFAEFVTVLGQRKFTRIGDIAVPVQENVTVADLDRTIRRGGRRAMDNFYNYALSNDWEYFCTYTAAEERVRVSIDLLHETWQRFIRTIKGKNPNVKVLAVPEAFEKEESGFHLHALMAGCDLRLVPKRYNPNDKADRYREADDDDSMALINEVKKSKYTPGQFMYTPYGGARMQCIDWKHGFNEVVMINPESAQLQVVNYLTKYLTKSFNLPYGAKRFYRTTNLACKLNFVENYDIEEIMRLVANLKLEKYIKNGKKKDNDEDLGVVVYRNF